MAMLRIHRPLIPMPYRTEEEMKKSPELAWEGAWLSFRPSATGSSYAAARSTRAGRLHL